MPNFSDGTSEEKTCRYIDDTHVRFGDGSGAYGLQHICEFAERVEKIEATVEPVTEPMIKLTERFYCPMKLAVFERDEDFLIPGIREFTKPRFSIQLIISFLTRATSLRKSLWTLCRSRKASTS